MGAGTTVVVPHFNFAAACTLDPKSNEHVNSTGGCEPEFYEENLTTGRCGVLCHHDFKHIEVHGSERKVTKCACDDTGSINATFTTFPRCIFEEGKCASEITEKHGSKCGENGSEAHATRETFSNATSVD